MAKISPQSLRVATLGNLLSDWLVGVEHFPVTPGDHQTLSELTLEPGGSCNFLIAGQRLGGEMAALDAIGADRYGEMLIEALAAEGVDVSQIVRVPGVRSRAVVVLRGSKGHHAFMGYPGGMLPEQSFSLGWQKAVGAATALFIDGFSLLRGYSHLVTLQAIEWAFKHGKKVFLDPGPMAAGVTREILAQVYAVMLTADELQDWVGVEGVEGAWSLLDSGANVVAIKRGSAGCTLVTAGQTFECPGYAVEVRDTLGAGDVFDAAFVLELLRGKSLLECGAYANAAGAATVQKFGAGRNVPMKDEIDAIYGKGM